MNLNKAFIILLFSMIILVSCQSHVWAGDIRISVAASMTEVFRELIKEFSVDHPEIVILPNFAGSGALAKQINQGAPSDLYVSANPNWMQYLVEQKVIDDQSLKIFAHNSLVFVGWETTKATSISDLSTLKRISIGSPASVPAGQYTMQVLTASGMYDSLLKAGKLVMAKDVRQALIYADRGEANGAFVYRTDALLAKNAVILFEVLPELHTQIAYPVALTKKGTEKTDAHEFYTFVLSDKAKAIMTRYGFTIPDAR